MSSTNADVAMCCIKFIENTPYFLEDYSRSTWNNNNHHPKTVKFITHSTRLLFHHVKSLVVPMQMTTRQMRLFPHITCRSYQATGYWFYCLGASKYEAKDKHSLRTACTVILSKKKYLRRRNILAVRSAGEGQ